MIGEGIASGIRLYKQVKRKIGRIGCIYTDANGCYDVAFKRHNVGERHIMSKAQTPLIESSNSSIRDKLGRFNGGTKRFSKSWDMLNGTLLLFFNKSMINLAI